MMSSVERWLQTFLCSQYARIFEAYGYKSLHSVCSLQLPHLLAMGVPRNHCEKILENMHNLRQTMFGHIPKSSNQDFFNYNKYNPSLNPAVCALKTVAMNANYRGMNQYPEEYSGYGQSGNNMQPVGFHQGSFENTNMAMMNPMGGAGGGGYAMSGYESGQSHLMMASQGQMSNHPAVYQQHSQQAYMAQQQQQQQQQQQYYGSSSASGGNSGAQYTNQAYPVQGGTNMATMGSNSPYYNTGGSQTPGSTGPRMVPPPHHHLRNTSGQQNPQQVADNILQMASSFPSHHTVQVPLKNRHAPYQIPRSPQNYYAEKSVNQQQNLAGQGPQQTLHNSQNMIGQQGVSGSQMQTKTSQAQNQTGQSSGICQSPAVMYAGSSPHNQMSQNSPTSPLMMPSPVAAHQSQSLSSPGALHSPSSAAVCSPVSSSPGLASMRSPSSMPMRSPAHIPSGYSGQPINSPQRPFVASDSSGGAQHCSPTSMHSPASHSSSPYAPAGMTHLNSPPQSQNYSSPAHNSYKMNVLMDSGQGPGGQRVQSTQGQRSDPLQSLQKLVMLPETQVVDPKSVVSDGCIQNCEDGSKNFEGPAEQSREAVDCSAGVPVACNPPTSGISSTVAICQEKPTESVCPMLTAVSQSGCSSVPQSHVHGNEGSAESENSVIALSGEKNSTQVTESQSCVQSVLRTQSNPVTPTSTSTPIKSQGEDDVLSCTSVPKVETVQTDSLDKPGSTVACSIEIVETKDLTITEKQELSSPAHCNGPLLPSESDDKMDKAPVASQTESCVNRMDDKQKPFEEIKTDVTEDGSIKQDSTLQSDDSSCTTSDTLKPSPPKKRHSQRLALNAKSGATADTLIKESNPSQIHCEKKTSSNKNMVLPLDNAKPSPPKKRHSRKLPQTSSPKSVISSSRTMKYGPVTDSEGNISLEAQQGLTSSDVINKGKLVNGVTDKRICSKESGAMEKLHTKNNNQQVLTSSVLEGKSVEIPEKVPDVSLTAKDKSRQLLTVHVNGPENGEQEATDDVVDLGESGIEKTVQGSISNSPSKTLTADLSYNISDSLTSQHQLFDDEDDSFSNELDFGYDSPPCEMEADDNWKTDLEKRTCTNGVDEADGNGGCADKDSDKDSNHTSEESPKASLLKTTSFVRTRSVTRSLSGQGVKRKLESDATDVKRTRRSSGATDHPTTMSLSMECDEIDTKGSISDVEVISSSDESVIKSKSSWDNKMKDRNNQGMNQTLANKSYQKSPVVVLTKSVTKSNRKDKKTHENDKMKHKAISPKITQRNSGRFYAVRGEGGRFISRKKANISPAALSLSPDASSSDKQLNMTCKEMDEGSGNVSEVEVENSKSTSRQHIFMPVTTCNSETQINSIDPQLHVSMDFKTDSASHLLPESSVAESSATSSACLSSKKAERKKEEARPATNRNVKKSVKKKKNKTHFMELDSVDTSFKNMKFNRTLNHLQRSKHGGKGQPVRQFSPFVRVQGQHSAPSSVLVYNCQSADGKDAAATSIQITNFSPDKSIMVPYTKTTEASWVCALCGKRSSYRFLGDLFGPYFQESQLPVVKCPVEGNKKDSKHDSVGSSEVQNPHNTRRKSLSHHRSSSADETVPTVPQEVWVHEDCAMWSSGVYVVGSRIYGLEEALKATATTMCACCQEKGALIGCLHKGCNQNFHYICAVDKMCFLDIENFSMLCPKHKEKRIKSASASTSKL